MNFSCDNCQRRYSIADEKVRGKTVRIRCKNCQNVITVTGPALAPEPEPEDFEEDRTRMVPLTEIEKIRASSLTDMPAVSAPPPPKDPWEDEPTRTAPPLDTSAQWFAMIKGQQVGPLDASGLSGKMAAGEINVRTYLWKQGMADWKRAADLPELATLLAGAQPSSPSPVAEPPRAAPRTWSEPEPQGGEPEPETGEEEGQQQGFEPEQDPQADGGSSLAPPLDSEPPTRESAPPATSGVGAADLFSDLDLDHRGDSQEPFDDPGVADDPTSPGMARPRTGKQQDPFAALGGIDPANVPPPSESTSTFIARSGVNRRNPPWKIATFVVLLIALPVGVLYLLSELKVVPLEIRRVDATGKEVKESVFSAEGVSDLRDLLLGRKPEPVKPPPAPEKPHPRAAQPEKDKDKAPPKPGEPTAEELKALYKDDSGGKHEVAPEVRKDEAAIARSSSTEGPDQKEIARVLAQSQPAFKSCIEQEMRKNPRFKGGKVKITATVGSSGAVKSAAIDRPEIDASGLGECLKGRARRMVFPSFAGDDVDVEIPLILSSSL